MHISELLQTAEYRKAFTKALYTLADDASIGVVLTAAQVHEILTAIEDPTADAMVFHAIVAEIAAENADHKILAVKNSEKGLMVYGCKCSYIEFDDVDDATGQPCTSHSVGLFGSTLPESVRLQVTTEKVGSGDKEYLRPVAKIMQDHKNAKGKTLTATLEVGILDTIKLLKIEYKDWVSKALNKDEDELVEAGLMGQWAEPKLGSGGDRVNLTQLGEDAMQFGPQTYEVIAVRYEAKEDTRSGYAQVGFDLCLDGGAPISTYSEVVFGLEKLRERGGIGFSDMVADALECGVKYYLHVLGTKPKMRWDKVRKVDVPYLDKNGQSWTTIDGYLSDVSSINPRLLRQAYAPTVQPALVGATPMKSAAPAEPDFDDIPF